MFFVLVYYLKVQKDLMILNTSIVQKDLMILNTSIALGWYTIGSSKFIRFPVGGSSIANYVILHYLALVLNTCLTLLMFTPLLDPCAVPQILIS